MGWFDEQIKQRRKYDDRVFEETFCRISDSVTGKNFAKLLQSDRERTLGAIGDILRSYGCRLADSQKAFDDINDELEFQCRPNGIMRRTVELKEGWYKDAFGAYLATDSRDGSVVALIPDRKTGKYRYFDTEKGKEQVIRKKNAAYFNGDAICFYKPLPLRPLKASDLFRYGMSVWSLKDVAAPVILLLIMSLLGLLTPKLNHFLFSEVYYTENLSFLLSTVFFLAMLSVSNLLFNAVHTVITQKNATKTSVSIQSAIMMRVLSLPADFFKQFSSGEITQRIAYANSVCDILIEIFFDTGILSVLSLIYITQMVKYAASLLLPALAIIIATVLFSLVLTLVGLKNVKQRLETEAKENGVAYSLLSGIQKIKLSGAEKRAFAKWGGYYAESSKVCYNPPLLLKLGDAIPLAISLIGTALIFFFALRSEISVADYYAFETAYSMVLGAFMSIAGITDRIANIRPTLEMIAPIMDATPEVSEGKQLITRLTGNIEMSHVSFRYSQSMPPVLDDLSLKIKAGQYVAIVGKTGCGKSTLMRILLGFEKPAKGAVYYDGKDLNNIDLKSLRRNIGTVMQNGKLFQGDIYSNIVISAPWLTLDDAWKAAEMAGIADDIRRMPMQMQTLVADGGGGISGGQRQRLMIARAIAPSPKILFFDEATSALDNLTQKIVSDSLDTLSCTRIVIAHRLSTIRHCDRIIFLDGGKIAEDGTYDELIAKNGLFAELVRRQQLDD